MKEMRSHIESTHEMDKGNIYHAILTQLYTVSPESEVRLKHHIESTHGTGFMEELSTLPPGSSVKLKHHIESNHETDFMAEISTLPPGSRGKSLR